MSNKHLYEKFSNGDRRTVVKKYSKGHELKLTESTIVLKADVALKVTEEYNLVSRRWNDVSYDISTMVEIPDGEFYKESRPAPTAMPGPLCDHVAAMTTSGPCPICFPRAEARSSWWERFKSWFAPSDEVGQ